MVESALYIALVTFQMGFLIRGVLGQSLFAVAHAVRFYIGFGYDIDTVLVT